MAIVVLGLTTLLIVLFVKTFNAFKELNKSLETDLPFTYSLSSEDSGLIAGKYRGELKVNRIIRSKVRGPVSLIYFGKDYHLIVVKIELGKDTLLKGLMHIAEKSVHRTTGVIYSVISHNDLYKFQYQSGLSRPISEIYLTLYGDSVEGGVRSDSIISYSLLCHDFSIRYKDNDPIDIFLAGQDRALGTTNIVPMDLLFLKRKKAVYLLMMTPEEPKRSIPPDLLYNVVVGY